MSFFSSRQYDILKIKFTPEWFNIIMKSIKIPNHPAYHWITLWPLEVWVRELYNSWLFCVHKLSMFIYLSMGKPNWTIWNSSCWNTTLTNRLHFYFCLENPQFCGPCKAACWDPATVKSFWSCWSQGDCWQCYKQVFILQLWSPDPSPPHTLFLERN